MKRDWVLVTALSAALAGTAIVAWTLTRAAAPSRIAPANRAAQIESSQVLRGQFPGTEPRQLHEPIDCVQHAPQFNIPERPRRP